MMETASEVLNRYRASPQYSPNTVYIAGKSYKALDIPAEDFEILKQELDAFVDEAQDPVLARMVARGSPRILDGIRLVNDASKNGFKGAAARAMELLFNPLIVADINAAGAATAKTTWLTTVNATGAANWSGSSAAANLNNMLVSSLPVLCHVYLGFINPIEIPKVNMLQLVKNGDAMAREYLPYNWRQTFGANRVPTYELKQPWIIPPGENYYIPVNYYLTGDDKLEPIAFTVRRATDIIAALA